MALPVPGRGASADRRGTGGAIRYVIFCPVALDMADRLGALGGSLQVESAPQRGTTVSGAIPVGAGTGAR